MSDPQVNAALAEIEWLRKASKKYALLAAKIAKLRAEESTLSRDSVANMVERSVLEQEQASLKPFVENNQAQIYAATEKLWLLSGVEVRSVITKDFGAMVMKRLGQGYSNAKVAMLMGCSPSVVSSIKTGKYRYSNLPADAKIGSRGR